MTSLLELLQIYSQNSYIITLKKESWLHKKWQEERL